MKRYILKAIQKTNKLYNVVDGNNNLVRAKCTLNQVQQLYNSGLCYAISYKHL
ncbi:MAG: hypothetical protein IKG40_03575 [Bacilli bacterium]|nr:hypothetical protein [Bacilli bacterium]